MNMKTEKQIEITNLLLESRNKEYATMILDNTLYGSYDKDTIDRAKAVYKAIKLVTAELGREQFDEGLTSKCPF